MQIPNDKNTSRFPFQRYGRLPGTSCLDRNEHQLTDADSRSANRLQNQAKSLIVLLFRSPAQPFIFSSRQFLFLGSENLRLTFDRFDLAILPTEKREQTAERRDDTVDTPYSITVRNQFSLFYIPLNYFFIILSRSSFA